MSCKKDKKDKKDDKTYFDHLKAKNACVKNLKSLNTQFDKVSIENATIKNETVENSNIVSLTANQANINNLNVSTINGQCFSQINQNTNSNFQIVFDNQQPTNPGQFNQAVWDALWANALNQFSEPCLGLSARLRCGRLTERFRLNENGCTICPNEFPNCNPVPSGTTGPCFIGPIPACPYISDETNCPNVSGRILGIQTFPIRNFKDCPGIGNNPSTLTSQILSAVSYNLDVLNVNPFLSTRVVSVMVQAAALTEPFEATTKLTQIDFANKQFAATLDTLYGEKFAANILLPTDLMQNYGDRNGAVQIVIYIEEGIEVQILPTLRSKAITTLQNTNRIGSISSQYLNSTYNVTQLTNPGDTAVFFLDKFLYKVIAKGGGGGGGGAFSFLPAGSPTAGGGGGEGYTIIEDPLNVFGNLPLPPGIYSLRLDSLGQGGQGGQGGIGPDTYGGNGSSTVYSFIRNGTVIKTITASGGGGAGEFLKSGGDAGNGVDGIRGGGGGAGGIYDIDGSNLQGGDGVPPGNDSSGRTGGAGGNGGAAGAADSTSIESVSGGGGGGVPRAPDLSILGSGAKGGDAGQPGESVSNIPGRILGTGGGGGGANSLQRSTNGGNGGVGCLFIIAIPYEQ